MGGVGRTRADRGLPQLPGVSALGFHTTSRGLHPALSHSDPPLSVNTFPPRVQTQEPAEGSIFQ